MEPDMPDLWTMQDHPILLEIAKLLEVENENAVDAWTIARTTDCSPENARRSLLRLYHHGYVDGAFQSGLDGDSVIVHRLTERGLREVEIWPNTTRRGEAFIQALEKAANHESDPEKKNKLRQMAQTARSVGEGIVGNLIAAVITKSGGM
jgi:predicted ArsR family transcriptional regulator